MLTKFLDPKNDWAFKRIFGTERNKDILIHFLNDMALVEHHRIHDVTFLPTAQDADLMAKKTSIVDVLCTDEQGHQYIIEMQVAKEKGFEKRAQYYASRAYGGQLQSGQGYDSLKPVLFLAITDFVMFPQHQRYKSDHVILDNTSHERDLKDLAFTFVELPKFHKSMDQLESMVDKWCYFFKHAEHTDEKDVARIVEGDTILGKAYEELNRFTWNGEEMRAYESVIKYERDHIAQLEQKFDEGIEKGIKKGKADIVRSMISAGLSDEQIAHFTHMPLEDIKRLRTQT